MTENTATLGTKAARGRKLGANGDISAVTLTYPLGKLVWENLGGFSAVDDEFSGNRYGATGDSCDAAGSAGGRDGMENNRDQIEFIDALDSGCEYDSRY